MKNLFKKLKAIWWGLKLFVAQIFFGNPAGKLKIVGVTGTNGKTTTVTLLYEIARALGHKAGLVSTVEILAEGEKIDILKKGSAGPGTTPDSVVLTKIFKQMVDRGCEYVFMEVSSHAMDQNRVAGINFAGGIFSNLTQDHLDYHKDMENYFLAKKKFFQMLSAEAFALANIDDVSGLRMLEDIRARKYTYGFNTPSDFSEKLETKLIGNFNAYNALAVFAAATLLWEDKEKIKEIIKNIEPPRGRFEHFTSGTGVLVIVDYAHTPDALLNVLQTIKQLDFAEVGLRQKGKTICVFGCGGDRDPIKRPIMGKIGAKYSDIAIFTSDNPRSEDPEKIIEQMKTTLTPEELQKARTISNRYEAIKEAVRIAQAGDIILCAGKGHEDYQEIKGVRNHFDDMEEFKKIFQ